MATKTSSEKMVTPTLEVDPYTVRWRGLGGAPTGACMLVPLTHDGNLKKADRASCVLAASNEVTDVVIMCHGLNTQPVGARQLYSRFFRRLDAARLLANEGRPLTAPLYVGLHWHSSGGEAWSAFADRAVRTPRSVVEQEAAAARRDADEDEAVLLGAHTAAALREVTPRPAFGATAAQLLESVAGAGVGLQQHSEHAESRSPRASESTADASCRPPYAPSPTVTADEAACEARERASGAGLHPSAKPVKHEESLSSEEEAVLSGKVKTKAELHAVAATAQLLLRQRAARGETSWPEVSGELVPEIPRAADHATGRVVGERSTTAAPAVPVGVALQDAAVFLRNVSEVNCELTLALEDDMLDAMPTTRGGTQGLVGVIQASKMRQRACDVGSGGGLRELLLSLLRAGKRVHLIGHSFGCKVMCEAVRSTFAADDAGDLPRLASLLLVQPALSQWALEKTRPEAPFLVGRVPVFPGMYAGIRDHLEQPVVVVYSNRDGVLRQAFPLWLGGTPEPLSKVKTRGSALVDERVGDTIDLKDAECANAYDAALGAHGGPLCVNSHRVPIRRAGEQYTLLPRSLRKVSVKGEWNHSGKGLKREGWCRASVLWLAWQCISDAMFETSLPGAPTTASSTAPAPLT